MLTSIKSVIFQEKTINFHKGLNVVLGDNKGSNSIGKSTLLMIIDFVFGGQSYITHNKDMVLKLGHHDFFFTFKFEGLDYYFMRGTEESKIVYESNSDYEKLTPIRTEEYRVNLKELYKLDLKYISFRSAVSTFSRVWGKNNYDVNKPLHDFPNQGFKETVINLMRLFNKFDEIAKQDQELKILDNQRKVLNKASNYKFIPQITKSKYDKNLIQIENITEKIERIGKKAYSPSIQISEIVTEELIKIRAKKNTLLDEKEYYKSRLNRTNRTIKRSAGAGFESLLEFFPNVNLEKLREIESFHNGISSILSNEIKAARTELTEKIKSLEVLISNLNKEEEKLLNPDGELNVFIDKLIEYTSEIKKIQIENSYYLKLSVIKSDIKIKEESLEEIKKQIINDISTKINSKTKEINDLIHQDKRTAPEIDLTYTTYDYKVFDNTGTGKAYTNLIIFDLTIFTLTKLPFLIHDSFLFKNIEPGAVEQIIKFYNSMSKQVFIAIDLIDMFNEETQQILVGKKVIQLSKDKLLTTKDWRDNKKDIN